MPVSTSSVNVDFLGDVASITSNWFKPLDVDCHSGLVLTVSWSPGGQYLASGGHDGKLKLWDVGSSVCVQSVDAHAGPLCSVAWAAHDNLVASGGQDAFLKIWGFDLCLLSPLSELPLDPSNLAVFVDVVAWSPCSGLLAAGSSDGHTRIWNISRNAIGQLQVEDLQVLDGLAKVTALSWSPVDEQLACAGSDSIICVHPSSQKHEEDGLRYGEYASWHSVSWCPDHSRNLFVAGNEFGKVVLFQMQDRIGCNIGRQHPFPVHMLAWAPGATHIASGSSDGTIHIIDILKTNQPDKTELTGRSGGSSCFFGAPEIVSNSNELGCLAWAPAGRRIAKGGGSGGIEFMSPPKVVVGTRRCHKEQLQEKFGVLLCEWANDLMPEDLILEGTTQKGSNLPALSVDGTLVTFSEMQWVKFPEDEMVSFVAAVTVDFDMRALAEGAEAPILVQGSTCTCSLGQIASACSRRTPKPRKLFRAVYFIFRGVAEIHNWIHNLSIQLNMQAYRAHGVSIHSAFQQEIENRNFLEFPDFTESLSVAVRERSDVIFTGHSQGGAHALALFTELSLRQKETLHKRIGCSQSSTQRMLESARLVSFGSPTVFATKTSPSAEFTSLMLRGRNYALRNDPVPRSYCRAPDWVPKLLESIKTSALSRILPELPWIFRPSEESVNDHLKGLAINRALDVINYSNVEALARQYFHAVELVVIAGGGKHWDDFVVSPDSFLDHAVAAYADFLCMSNFQRHQHYKAPQA